MHIILFLLLFLLLLLLLSVYMCDVHVLVVRVSLISKHLINVWICVFIHSFFFEFFCRIQQIFNGRAKEWVWENENRMREKIHIYTYFYVGTIHSIVRQGFLRSRLLCTNMRSLCFGNRTNKKNERKWSTRACYSLLLCLSFSLLCSHAFM